MTQHKTLHYLCMKPPRQKTLFIYCVLGTRGERGYKNNIRHITPWALHFVLEQVCTFSDLFQPMVKCMYSITGCSMTSSQC